VVGEDHCGERGSLEVVSPCFKGVDYAHEFSVIYFIVSLCRIKGVGDVSTGVVVAVHVFLSYDCSGGELGGIGFNDEWFRRIRHQKHWCFLELSFQILECFLASIRPIPNQIFLRQVIQGSRDVRVVSDEFPIEVSKS